MGSECWIKLYGQSYAIVDRSSHLDWMNWTKRGKQQQQQNNNTPIMAIGKMGFFPTIFACDACNDTYETHISQTYTYITMNQLYFSHSSTSLPTSFLIGKAIRETKRDRKRYIHKMNACVICLKFMWVCNCCSDLSFLLLLLLRKLFAVLFLHTQKKQYLNQCNGLAPWNQCAHHLNWHEIILFAIP